jgi:hypothetical protein
MNDRRTGLKICCKEKTFKDCSKELINQQTIVCYMKLLLNLAMKIPLIFKNQISCMYIYRLFNINQ